MPLTIFVHDINQHVNLHLTPNMNGVHVTYEQDPSAPAVPPPMPPPAPP